MVSKAKVRTEKDCPSQLVKSAKVTTAHAQSSNFERTNGSKTDKMKPRKVNLVVVPDSRKISLENFELRVIRVN